MASRESYSVRIGPQGRVVIPAAIRGELGLAPGDTLVVRVEEGRLVLETRDQILDRMRRRWAAASVGWPNAVDELIADRREEARREEEELRRSGL